MVNKIDIVLLIDVMENPVAAVGFLQPDIQEAIEELVKCFKEANEPCVIHLSSFSNECGDLIFMIATNKIRYHARDFDSWNSILHNFLRTCEPNESKSFNIAKFCNLN